MLPVEASQIDVCHLGPAFTGTIERPGAPADVEAKLRLAEEADVLIAAAPVCRGSSPGMFKHFFGVVDPYPHADRPVLLAATDGDGPGAAQDRSPGERPAPASSGDVREEPTSAGQVRPPPQEVPA
ncbi:NADPH-dependent FMN reductase [Streptomyces sp. NPDC004609]|uniref:NADPH-dependent FMN reductase n=1 Tax=Streptomyces sp. NPDC004609 TaxID=3364704 RepID=UPI00368C8EAE